MSSMRITCNIYIIAYVTICYDMLRYTAYLLMVDTVLRPQFRCDENNTKFQQHESLSLPSSHTNMKATFPEVLSLKRGQYYPRVKSITNPNVVSKIPYIRTTKLRTLKLKFLCNQPSKQDYLLQAEY